MRPTSFSEIKVCLSLRESTKTIPLLRPTPNHRNKTHTCSLGLFLSLQNITDSSMQIYSGTVHFMQMWWGTKVYTPLLTFWLWKGIFLVMGWYGYSSHCSRWRADAPLWGIPQAWVGDSIQDTQSSSHTVEPRGDGGSCEVCLLRLGQKGHRGGPSAYRSLPLGQGPAGQGRESMGSWAQSGLLSLWFCKASKLRMDFMFVNGWGKKPKQEYFMTTWNYIKFKFQYPKLKFYWNAAMILYVISMATFSP
jgi:hypothetical protein